VIKHDFRAASLCLLDVMLRLRNCTGSPLAVQVQVRERGRVCGRVDAL
jgi:hypothetical protein